ncbi:MAG: alpha/beta fold hydrolase [Burkholderiaceae bacterium]|nr:alpha/beta fold hydrolase [Burkholderiaceae bacterium]
MAARLDWQRDGRDWPLKEHSRFVEAAGLRWHVQRLGHGPAWLLLHGTGAATHSWRDLAPRLARHATVVAIDLPGHGFTSAPPGFGMFSASYTLPGMAAAVGELLRVLKLHPHGIVGHSAATPLAAHLFAWRAGDPKALHRLIDGTGSKLDARGVELYGRLVRNPHHCYAALAMMAQWDVAPLWADLPRLGARLHLGIGARDRAVPPAQGRRVHLHVPGSTLVEWPQLGHLAHEEEPAVAARWLEGLARHEAMAHDARHV